MWIKGRHIVVDNQGRQISRDITLNLTRVIAFVALDEERTRLFFNVGHDLEDHRNANWVDMYEPKSKLDAILARHKGPIESREPE